MANRFSSSPQLPQSTAMELELLSSLLVRDGQIIPDVAQVLSPDDFYNTNHATIYQVILDLHKQGTPPNPLTVIEELKRRNLARPELNKIAVEIGGITFSNTQAKSYSENIKEKSFLRQLVRLGDKISRTAKDGTKDYRIILDNAEKELREIISETSSQKPKSIADFTLNSFESMRKDADRYFQRQTGFPNIDENQIFSPGLYVLGATPACGKTTFAWQLLEQLVNNGETCIFCSYEMSAFELFTKSYARELFKRDKYTNITAADIRKGSTSHLLNEVLKDAANQTNSVQLFEFRDETVDDLLRIIRPYCRGKDKSPVVCVDYLQIIPPSNDVKLTTDKARIDDIVHKLKTFQRETNTTFIIISSFNRVNYFSQVSFESFKDSGNIEYTADVVWALQLYVANTIKIGSTVSETRKKFEDAKMQQPREIQLKCLKNRQGNNYDCLFNYFSAHDFFEPCSESDFISAPIGTPIAEKDIPFGAVDNSPIDDDAIPVPDED